MDSIPRPLDPNAPPAADPLAANAPRVDGGAQSGAPDFGLGAESFGFAAGDKGLGADDADGEAEFGLEGGDGDALGEDDEEGAELAELRALAASFLADAEAKIPAQPTSPAAPEDEWAPDRLSREMAFAASSGDESRVQAFLRRGADARPFHDLRPDRFPEMLPGPALFWAVRAGSLACVRLLLPVSDLSARDAKGNSALALAIQRGRERDEENLCAALLLECASLVLADGLGRTPLMLAAAAGNAALVEALLPRSDARAVDINGRSAFWHALTSSTFRHARQADAEEAILAKLASLGGVNAFDGAGLTALMFCAMAGFPGFRARVLVEKLGADPALENRDGMTAAAFALEHSNWEFLGALAPSLSEAEAARALAAALAAAASGNDEAGAAAPRLRAAHEAHSLAREMRAGDNAAGDCKPAMRPRRV